MVEFENVTMSYPGPYPFSSSYLALNQVSFHIQEGQIFGLIGPNGAGKSTTIKLLLGLLFPQKGQIRIFNQPAHNHKIHRLIGYLPEQPYFYDYLTGHELLTYYGKLCALKPTVLKKRIATVLEQVGLQRCATQLIRYYSKGMMQRLGIAQAILHQPPLLFLDEPMSGLDPIGRYDMTRLLQDLRDLGMTILFSSHILHDVETLCQHITILHQGHIVGQGTLADILQPASPIIEVVANINTTCDDLINPLKQLTNHLSFTEQQVSLTVTHISSLNQVLNLIQQYQGEILSIKTNKASLEDYFIKKFIESPV